LGPHPGDAEGGVLRGETGALCQEIWIREGERWATAEVVVQESQEELVREIARIGTALLTVVEGFEGTHSAS